jgi:hypothetical protein
VRGDLLGRRIKLQKVRASVLYRRVANVGGEDMAQHHVRVAEQKKKNGERKAEDMLRYLNRVHRLPGFMLCIIGGSRPFGDKSMAPARD